jgi:hypothetical protein
VAALLLCELPAATREARSWILDQVTLLASRGEAGLKFLGIEQAEPGQPSREMIAIEVASIELAHALRSAWQSDERFSSIEMRVLRLHALPSAEFSAALFP